MTRELPGIEIIDPAILNDPERLLTVKKRPEIIRDYLQEGGILYTVFPKKGREARSSEQLAILDGGRLIACGSPNELAHSENPIARQFISGESY